MSRPTDLESVKKFLGSTADMLAFSEEPDIIICKPWDHSKNKQLYLGHAEFRDLARMIEELGGRYERGKGFFVIPKAPKEAIFNKSPPTPITCPNCGKGNLFMASRSPDFADFWYQCNLCKYQTKTPPEKPAEMPLPGGEAIPVVKEPPTAAKSPIPESEDEVAYLRSTYERLGALSPVLRAPSGEVIDGKHRLQVDPAWFSLVLRDVNDPVKVAMARLIINICRREVPAEEKTELLTQIAKLTGWTPQQISEATGMSLRWVYQYLPAELKGPEPEEFARARLARQEESSQVKVMPEVPGVEARRAEVPTLVQCENCSLQTLTPKDYEGHVLCPICYEETMKHPEKFVAKVKKLEFPAGPPEAGAPKPEPIDTGLGITCGECHQTFTLIHVAPNLHRLQKVTIHSEAPT